jgi:hypothetical protein
MRAKTTGQEDDACISVDDSYAMQFLVVGNCSSMRPCGTRAHWSWLTTYLIILVSTALLSLVVLYFHSRRRAKIGPIDRNPSPAVAQRV